MRVYIHTERKCLIMSQFSEYWKDYISIELSVHREHLPNVDVDVCGTSFQNSFIWGTGGCQFWFRGPGGRVNFVWENVWVHVSESAGGNSSRESLLSRPMYVTPPGSWPKDMSLLCGRHWSSSSIRQAVPALMQGIIWGYVKMLRVGRVLFFQRVKVPGAGSWMESETWLSDHCLYVPQLTYASIYQRTSWLLLTFGNYE